MSEKLIVLQCVSQIHFGNGILDVEIALFLETMGSDVLCTGIPLFVYGAGELEEFKFWLDERGEVRRFEFLVVDVNIGDGDLP